ncbi:MAG: hypothetical protein F4Z57_19960 [Gemmatimonadetes bacterium]|nr:hypothetical protein [Gemmatimonadota bacterium]MYC71677.1 hypothetical protein [Gemmatimonadota bacterium]MYI60731.1 hypothetical protein [Gemmatimonadota bacterium]
MTDSYRSEMLRALTGELTAHEREAFERALATDDALRAEWEHLQKVSGLLQESRADSFQPFFATRVAQRIKIEREASTLSSAETESLTDALVWLFRPFAPVAIAVVAFLALSNWNERELIGDDASFFAAIFAAVPATPEAAYVLDLDM